MDAWIGLAGFALVTTLTPGPNNTLLMASGANFGLRGSVAHMAGICAGFAVMVLTLGAGLVPALDGAPRLRAALQAAGLIYVAWLAWKVAHADAPGRGGAAHRPVGLWQAAAFQWVNPKAWAMVLAALATYGAALGGPLPVAVVFLIVGLPCHAIWVLAGRHIAALIAAPARRRLFNRVMALALIGSMAPLILQGA